MPEPTKIEKPKILLIDVAYGVTKAIKSKGFNYSEGSFGRPYRSNEHNDFSNIIINSRFDHDFTEGEIVVVDLEPPSLISKDDISGQTLNFLVYGRDIDPRPVSMARKQPDFNRIFAHGGVFVIFMEPFHETPRYEWVGRGEGHVVERFSNYGFLGCLNDLNFKPDTGSEIQLADDGNDLTPWLNPYLPASKFTNTVAHKYGNPNWTTLLVNKYSGPVGGIYHDEDGGSGLVILLPKIQDQSGLLLTLLTEALPKLRPDLFPYSTEKVWVHEDKYELNAVSLLDHKLTEIRAEYDQKIKDAEDNIKAEITKNQFLYDLITETDDALVQAVIKTFALLGFNGVVDVDKEMRSQGKAASLREDIQILDESPALIVEVKGIGGIPSDNNIQQATKHAVVFMKDNKRTDVMGFALINHQRNQPGLGRENTKPFRDEMLQYAAQMGQVLMTTWDLWKLTVNFMNNGWKPEQVKPLFYEKGRITPIPTHYKYCGYIKQTWDNGAFSIHLEGAGLEAADMISIEGEIHLYERDIESLQLKSNEVDGASKDDEVGVMLKGERPALKKGMGVFKISNNPS